MAAAAAAADASARSAFPEAVPNALPADAAAPAPAPAEAPGPARSGGDRNTLPLCFGFCFWFSFSFRVGRVSFRGCVSCEVFCLAGGAGCAFFRRFRAGEETFSNSDCSPPPPLPPLLLFAPASLRNPPPPPAPALLVLPPPVLPSSPTTEPPPSSMSRPRFRLASRRRFGLPVSRAGAAPVFDWRRTMSRRRPIFGLLLGSITNAKSLRLYVRDRVSVEDLVYITFGIPAHAAGHEEEHENDHDHERLDGKCKVKCCNDADSEEREDMRPPTTNFVSASIARPEPEPRSQIKW